MALVEGRSTQFASKCTSCVKQMDAELSITRACHRELPNAFFACNRLGDFCNIQGVNFLPNYATSGLT